MSRIPSKSSAAAIAAVLLTCLLSTGCATIGGSAGDPSLDLAQQDLPKCTVVLKPDKGTPKVIEMPLSEGATVQTALEQSKASRRFGRMSIHVLRPAQARGNSPAEPQKMQVKYDRQRREIEFDHDYALFPNDRVVFEEDPTNMVDDMFESFAGRMGLPMMTGLVK